MSSLKLRLLSVLSLLFSGRTQVLRRLSMSSSPSIVYQKSKSLVSTEHELIAQVNATTLANCKEMRGNDTKLPAMMGGTTFGGVGQRPSKNNKPHCQAQDRRQAASPCPPGVPRKEPPILKLPSRLDSECSTSLSSLLPVAAHTGVRTSMW